jgi:hypothetical protein
MKEELFQLYLKEQPNFLSVVRTFPQDDLAGPFLMSPDTHFQSQPSPLLIIGQETNGWSCHVNEIEKQMHTYENYNVGSRQGQTAFWNIIRKVENILGNDPCSCAWTNLSRFDLYGGKPHGEYCKVISRLDALIAKEIQIVSPKICLFFTGPDYDKRVRKIFEGIEFIEIPGWSPSQLVLLKHPLLPVYSFRSYHPKSLKLRRLEGKFIQTFSDFINSGLSVN